MNIQSTRPKISQPQKLNNPKIPQGATVTHDKETDCFHYEAPGHHYSVCRPNALGQGAVAAAVVGVPAFLGAFQNDIFGTLGAGLGGTITGVAGGAILGGAIAGYKSYHGSNKNPMYGVLGGMAGALGGAVAFPLLKQPGLWFGFTGAAVATGVAAVGVTAAMAYQNHQNTQDAIAHGWKPGT
jgi:hypothetical protein